MFSQDSQIYRRFFDSFEIPLQLHFQNNMAANLSMVKIRQTANEKHSSTYTQERIHKHTRSMEIPFQQNQNTRLSRI